MKEFRSDIAFLRALTVIFVIFYHFKVPYFTGEFIGVDIFFVLSGYLMTSIVVNSLDNNNFSLLSFYLRRVGRIIPALLSLIVICSAVSWLFLVEDITITLNLVRMKW